MAHGGWRWGEGPQSLSEWKYCLITPLHREKLRAAGAAMWELWFLDLNQINGGTLKQTQLEKTVLVGKCWSIHTRQTMWIYKIPHTLTDIKADDTHTRTVNTTVKDCPQETRISLYATWKEGGVNQTQVENIAVIRWEGWKMCETQDRSK